MTHILIPREPSPALLRPFTGCPADELPLAWAAMVRAAEVQNARAGAAPAAVAGPAWDKTRDSLATLLLGLARHPFLDFDVACIALDAATEPGMPLGYMRGAPAAPALEAPAAGLPEDTFQGDTSSLVRNILALLELDAKGALVPHGVGGHARGLLSAAAARLAAAPQASAAPSAYSRSQHDADSRELRSLCITRDAARRERDLARVEIAGLQASIGHLSALVDGQHALLEKAKATMTALHGAASPVDESRGDLDARIPASAFARFVDAHAELLHAMAQSPVAAPAAPGIDQLLDALSQHDDPCEDIADALDRVRTLRAEADSRIRAENTRVDRMAHLSPGVPTPSVLNVLRVALNRANMDYRATGFKTFEIDAAKTWIASAAPAAPAVHALSQAAQDVLAERRRQVEAEGYDTEHDDTHVMGEIGALAALYLMPDGARDWDATSTTYGVTLGQALLPEDWTMPKMGENRRRDVVKGIACGLAELERLDRAAAAHKEST